MYQILKKRIKSLNISFNPKYILAYWATGKVLNNWGDALNPVVIEHLSKKKIIYYNTIKNYTGKPVYSVIGSYLGNKIPLDNLHFWGSGFWRSVDEPQVEEAIFHAVRGPLSRNKLIKAGYECPEIYGDPALLYPMFYRPDVKKKYSLGVIPHYRDKNSPILDIFKQKDVLIIDIESGINNVVDQICQCHKIASSSLHGVIAADSYAVPSIWVSFEDHPINDDFKFQDYLTSVNKKPTSLTITQHSTLDMVLDHFLDETPELDIELLLKSCPFLSKKIRDRLNPDVVFSM